MIDEHEEEDEDPIELTVPESADGERLDRFLADALKGPSRALLQKHIDKGGIAIDGKVAAASRTAVRSGQVIQYRPPPPDEIDLVPEEIPLSLLYEDEHFLIVDKQRNLVVHPAAGHRSGTLANAVLFYLQREKTKALRPGIVHRLDRDTTGAIIVAKNESAQDALSSLFQERRVVKQYVAAAIGVFEKKRATIDTSYGRHPTDRKRFSSRVLKGKRAITHYTVEAQFARAARLEVRLETGRTHQIRVHLADQGHPLVGDETYGGKRARSIDQEMDRPALHALRLVFEHPFTNAQIDVTAPVPPDLSALFDRLGRQGP